MITKKIVWRCASRIKKDNFSIHDLLREVMKEVDLIRDYKDEHQRYSVQDIIDTICLVTNLEENQLKSPTRVQHILHARHCAMNLIYSYTSLSLKKTGEIFNRDHATVISSNKLIENALEGYNDKLAGIFRQCEDMLFKTCQTL